MSEMQRYKREIIQKTLFFAFVVTIAAVLLSKQMLFAFVWGAIVSVFNFHMLSHDLTKAVMCSRGAMRSFLFGRFLIRYVIMGVAIVGALYAQCDIILFVGGLCAVQIVIFYEHCIRSRMEA